LTDANSHFKFLSPPIVFPLPLKPVCFYKQAAHCPILFRTYKWVTQRVMPVVMQPVNKRFYQNIYF